MVKKSFLAFVSILGILCPIPPAGAQTGDFPRLVSRVCVDEQFCAGGPQDPVCREWCLITADGRDVPLGRTCCPAGASEDLFGLASCSPLLSWSRLAEALEVSSRAGGDSAERSVSSTSKSGTGESRREGR